jgi:hypothetical protein
MQEVKEIYREYADEMTYLLKVISKLISYPGENIINLIYHSPVTAVLLPFHEDVGKLFSARKDQNVQILFREMWRVCHNARM